MIFKRTFLIVPFLFFSTLFAFEDLTSENFEEKTINKKVILDFYTIGCSACVDVNESLTVYNKNKKDDVHIYKIDMLKEKALAKEFSVNVLPTLIYFKNDEIIERELGRKIPEQIAKSAKKYLLTN